MNEVNNTSSSDDDNTYSMLKWALFTSPYLISATILVILSIIAVGRLIKKYILSTDVYKRFKNYCNDLIHKRYKRFPYPKDVTLLSHHIEEDEVPLLYLPEQAHLRNKVKVWESFV